MAGSDIRQRIEFRDSLYKALVFRHENDIEFSFDGFAKKAQLRWRLILDFFVGVSLRTAKALNALADVLGVPKHTLRQSNSSNKKIRPVRKMFNLRRNCMIAFITATAILQHLVRSDAADDNGQFIIKSATSCAAFSQAYRDEESARARVSNPDLQTTYNSTYTAYTWYILGFVTGANQYLSGYKDTMPIDHLALFELIHQECKSHPTISIAIATSIVISNNRKNWQ